MSLLAKWVCVIQEWLIELEAFQLLQYGPQTVQAMKESRQQEQECSCMQGTVRYEVHKYVNYV